MACKDMASCVLDEKDFYPPADNRVLESNVYDTDGDTFEDYAKDMYTLLEEEGYYDN